MEEKLRDWARTGEYHEPELPQRPNDHCRSESRSRRHWIPEGPGLVLLIPIGVTLGLFFAVALLLRLLATPFMRSADPPTL